MQGNVVVIEPDRPSQQVEQTSGSDSDKTVKSAHCVGVGVGVDVPIKGCPRCIEKDVQDVERQSRKSRRLG